MLLGRCIPLLKEQVKKSPKVPHLSLSPPARVVELSTMNTIQRITLHVIWKIATSHPPVNGGKQSPPRW
jgi:hypothetical protein